MANRFTWTKTDALLFKSHRNSAALSWEGCVLGSTMPTDMGISAGHTHIRTHFSEHPNTPAYTRRDAFAAALGYRYPINGRRADSTSIPPAAGVPCTEAAGRGTRRALCSTLTHTPCHTNDYRTRVTVRVLTFTILLVSSGISPGFLLSNMRTS